MKKYLAEFAGTFILVFMGVWSIEYSNVNLSENFQASLWLITVVFGLAVTLVILMFGNTSGAHINPAVSIAFYYNKSLTLTELIFYITSQCFGAIIGAYLFNLIYPSEFIGTTLPSVSVPLAFSFELILSIILMMVIFWIADSNNKYTRLAPYVIGFQVAFNTYIVGLLTSVSMNPARSIGPALVSGHWEHYWIYLVAPILGMIISYNIWNKIK
ncbi:MAG: aquaporin [Bacteroidia bacterium]|nr:aquaporin [Bacteroidia bacterium]